MGKRLEKVTIPDQKNERRKEAIFKRVHDLQSVLGRQGEVTASWRVYRGKRLGPYWRPVYQHEGRSRSLSAQ